MLIEALSGLIHTHHACDNHDNVEDSGDDFRQKYQPPRPRNHTEYFQQNENDCQNFSKAHKFILLI